MSHDRALGKRTGLAFLVRHVQRGIMNVIPFPYGKVGDDECAIVDLSTSPEEQVTMLGLP